jgi:hypothetical protein
MDVYLPVGEGHFAVLLLVAARVGDAYQLWFSPSSASIYVEFLTAGKSGGSLQSHDPCSFAAGLSRVTARNGQRGLRDALSGNESVS